MAQSESLTTEKLPGFPRVLVIVPAYNEEESIRDVVAGIKRSRHDSDILVVNDCSMDRTAEMARETGVRVLDLPINLRIGGAVQTGFEYARREGYDIVIQVDGDGQHDTKYMDDLLTPLIQDIADISVGSRYLNAGKQRRVLIRNLGIRYFSWLATRLTGQKISDCTSGFRALNRKAYGFFAEHYPVDFPDAEALILASRAGLRIVEVPVRFRERIGGESSLHFWRMIYYPFKEMLAILMLITKRAEPAFE